MNNNGMIVAQDNWDKGYKNINFSVVNNSLTDFIDNYINEYLSNGNSIDKCFELGCFPGGYLAHFCKKYGFVANGVDLTTELNENFINWLKKENIQIGDIYNDNVFTVIPEYEKSDIKFDFVYSLGFIEHFKNYKEVILEHGKILKKRGLLVITTPNFRGGLQYIMHRLVDKQNLDNHVLDSMRPKEWKKLLENNGYSILFYGFIGGFCFWVENQKRNFIERFLLKLIYKFSSFCTGRLKRNSSLWSPYICIVAVKN